MQQALARRCCSALPSTAKASSSSGLLSSRLRPQRGSESIIASNRSPLQAKSYSTGSLLATRRPSQHAFAGQHHNPARSFSSSGPLLHGGKGRPAPGTGIKVTFKNNKGEVLKTVEANEGDDIVDLSWEYDLDIEAACEKSIACSTCHVILDEATFDKLPEATDEENDMLDMAFGLEDTSRLGCQCKITREMDGATVSLPSATRNMAVDGHKAKH